MFSRKMDIFKRLKVILCLKKEVMILLHCLINAETENLKFDSYDMAGRSFEFVSGIWAWLTHHSIVKNLIWTEVAVLL